MTDLLLGGSASLEGSTGTAPFLVCQDWFALVGGRSEG